MPDSPAYALAQDPAYLAFLRASGLSNEIAAADVARQQLGIQQALGLSNEDLDSANEQEQRSIKSSQESRGATRSSETLRRQTDQAQSLRRRRGALEQGAADRLSGLQSNLEQQIANQQLKGAELALNQSAAYDLNYGQDALDLASYAPVPAPAAAPQPAMAPVTSTKIASVPTARRAGVTRIVRG